MPRWLILTVDFCYLLFLAVLIGLPLGAAGVALGALEPALGVWRWFLLPILGLGALIMLLIEVAILHWLTPRPRPGRHPIPSLTAAMWLLRFWLQRAVFQAAWREILMGSVVLRTLALGALGGRVSLRANLSSDATISEVYLVQIGARALIGTGAFLSAHVIVGEELILAPVRIEEGAQVFAEAAVGPGSTIGRGATVGFGATVGPSCTLGEGASLGLGATATRDVRIGAGAVVGPYALLLRGAVVEAGQEVPAGAIIGPPSSDTGGSHGAT